MLDLRATITAAVRADGRSISAIARAAGIHEAHLHRYMSGRRDATGRTLDKLLAALGLELRNAQDAQP
jgi:DNA-binding phage protein